jgi:CRP-like cAMP-binding protein
MVAWISIKFPYPDAMGAMVFTPSRDSGKQRQFRSALEETFQKRDLVHLAAGSSVPLLRNHIWLVVRGMVKLSSITLQGDELLLGLAGPNEPFGAPLSHLELTEATTLCDSDVLCLSMEEIQGSPHLAMALVRAMASRMRQSESLISLLGLRRVEDRVRGFLELLAEDYGQPCDQGLQLNLRLTHQDLASALSTTRVTVTRVLGLLRDEGWLQILANRQLVVTHLPQKH